MRDQITILIIDTQTLLRDALTFLINSDNRFRVVGDSGNADEAFNIALIKRPDVVLMESNLNGSETFDIAQKITDQLAQTKILVVSSSSHPAIVKRMLKIGAMGYVTKTSSAEEIVSAVVQVADGQKYLCATIKNLLIEEIINPSLRLTISDLSRRELEILKLIKQGFSSKLIGEQLKVATKTVEVHRYRILKKFEVKNTIELVNRANSNGF